MQTILSFFTAVVLLVSTLGSYVSPLPMLRNAEAKADVSAVEAVLPREGGSDPWFYEHDGMYHYCYSIGEGVAIRHASHPLDLPTGDETIAYRAPRDTMYSWAYWAPELHYIDGMWYLYVAASDTESEHHRMYVLQSDDVYGTFTMVGKIADSSDKWAIDGTVLPFENELYFVWSGWEGDTDGQQNLYIAHMSDPCHIDSNRVLLSAPTHLWEKHGMPINEGPQILQKDGALYLVFSASGRLLSGHAALLRRRCAASEQLGQKSAAGAVQTSRRLRSRSLQLSSFRRRYSGLHCLSRQCEIRHRLERSHDPCAALCLGVRLSGFRASVFAGRSSICKILTAT